MTRAFAPKLSAYAGLAALGLVAALATRLPELVVLAAPFALLPVVGILTGRSPRVRAVATLDRERAIEGEEVDVTIELAAAGGVPRLDVLIELPKRIHQWMPRLAEEGIVGADAIFACLGPALEIYSRFSQVKTPGDEVIPLGDRKDERGNVIQRGYLSFVWEAVAKEALSMIFAGADATGFDPGARLTALWF